MAGDTDWMELRERGRRMLDTAFFRTGAHDYCRPPGVRCPIVLYHDVTTDPRPWDVLPSRFRRQIGWFDRTFELLSLSDAMGRWHEGTLPSNPAVVTFDDGPASAIEHALPILEEHGIPATHYVTPGLLGDRLEGTPIMDREEVALLARRGQEIGAHTMTHPDLTAIPPEHARSEIERSRDALESLTDTRPSSFAYPYGAFDRDLARTVADLGFETATTVVAADVVDFAAPFSLPRIPIRREYTLEDVMALVAGARRWQYLLWAGLDEAQSRITVSSAR